MFLRSLKYRIFFCSFFLLLFSIIFYCLLFSVFKSDSIIFPYSITPFDIALQYSDIWTKIKNIYIYSFIFSNIIISNYLFSNFIIPHLIKKNKLKVENSNMISNNFNLIIGNSTSSNAIVFVPLQSLYQNILITGTIGSGKTSSAIYPFTDQLIKYNADIDNKKFGLLILDVKGNYYEQVKKIAKKYNREQDVIEISLFSNIFYNPLDKPDLKPTILANRLKTILELFSKNNSESYWLDKSEQILLECIKFCRLYNDGYVTFEEIHKLITDEKYYYNKLKIIKKLFFSNYFSEIQKYDLLSSIDFFEKEFFGLDQRTSSILKSEITRITSSFVSDYHVLSIFSPPKNKINFFGFSDLINSGKIVVLNMNIAEYKNLSKIIAAYLKLDFQSTVISRLSSSKLNNTRPVVFISDEFHEYVTSTDADFFALSREARCINIIATQSYTSIINALNNIYAAKVIIQNLINKLWFRTDDSYTIEEIQKQIGKEEKEKYSKSISENSKESHYNYLLKKFNSFDSNLSETFNQYTQTDFVYDSNFFTQHLETFSCLAFLSDGLSISKPQKINMFQYFKNQ